MAYSHEYIISTATNLWGNPDIWACLQPVTTVTIAFDYSLIIIILDGNLPACEIKRSNYKLVNVVPLP